MKKYFFAAIIFPLFIFGLFFTVHSTSASGNLVGYWKLDETTQGATAVDSSGSGNNGTGVGTGGGPSPSTDVPSVSFSDPQSASFNGTDQYINCGDTPSNLPSGSQARTISAWIKGTSFGGGTGTSIAGWGNDVGGELSELRVNSSGKIEFHGNSNDIAGSTTLSTGQWYFVAATVTSGGAVTLYVNGTQDGTGTVSLNTTEANCKIGRQPDFVGQYFNGLIDDVRIYNAALTGTDISDMASGDSGPDVPTPTPTVTPTPTPTSAPSSQSTSNSGSNSTSSAPSTTSTPVCSAQTPPGAPDLFQIDAQATQATLYFSPVNNPVSNYYISYGHSSGDERFGTLTNQGESSGVLSYTINDLSPNTVYYFRIHAQNNCKPGDFGNEIKINTTKGANSIRYYKNFVSQILSVFPHQTTVLNTAVKKSEPPTTASSCIYTIQPGDSLWGIAQDKLGSGIKYQQIETLNHLNTTVINVGQKLKIGC